MNAISGERTFEIFHIINIWTIDTTPVFVNKLDGIHTVILGILQLVD